MREGGEIGKGVFGGEVRRSAFPCLVTPEDVHSKVFTTVRLREGYDLAEVDTFLGRVETTLARLLRDNEELNARLAESVAAAQPFSVAEEGADRIIAEAREEAERILADARARAHTIEHEARETAAALERDARERHQAAMRNLKKLLEDLEELEDLDNQPPAAGPGSPVGALPVPAQHWPRHAAPVFEEALTD